MIQTEKDNYENIENLFISSFRQIHIFLMSSIKKGPTEKKLDLKQQHSEIKITVTA